MTDDTDDPRPLYRTMSTSDLAALRFALRHDWHAETDDHGRRFCQRRIDAIDDVLRARREDESPNRLNRNGKTRMPVGPGKYGKNAEALLRKFGGTLCAVILFGNRGPGFDVATTDKAQLRLLPALLRDVADSIETDMQQGGSV